MNFKGDESVRNEVYVSTSLDSSPLAFIRHSYSTKAEYEKFSLNMHTGNVKPAGNIIESIQSVRYRGNSVIRCRLFCNWEKLYIANWKSCVLSGDQVVIHCNNSDLILTINFSLIFSCGYDSIVFHLFDMHIVLSNSSARV